MQIDFKVFFITKSSVSPSFLIHAWFVFENNNKHNKIKWDAKLLSKSL